MSNVDLCRSPFCLVSLREGGKVSETHIKSLTKLETSDKSEFDSQTLENRKGKQNTRHKAPREPYQVAMSKITVEESG